ncbi:MAG: T9SS type A sorting domain-containing protein [Candidatus Cloacimonetes bacterium]|nr:T9SS type A sorting domain-containing protein [Candidatus Cloacimonadota bacterium]
MKKTLLVIYLLYLAVTLLTYDIPDISTIEYHSDIYRVNSYYESSIVIIDDRLFIDSKYAFEEYSIHDNGELELLSYEIYNYNYSVTPLVAYGNTIYQVLVNVEDLSSTLKSIIRALEITGDSIIETNSLEIIDPWHCIFNLQLNDDYIFYNMTGSIHTHVIDRETFEPITNNLLTGGYFAVNNDLLFMQMINYPDSTYVSIQDISDVNNPVELSRIYSNDTELNRYEFVDDLLIILKNTRVILVDISDHDNPVILSIIEDFPHLPSHNAFNNALIYEDYLIIMNDSSMLYVFDLNNPYSPVLLNTYIDDDSLQCIKKPLIVNNNYLYFGRQKKGIAKIDLNHFPDTITVNDILKNKHIGTRFLLDKYFLFTVNGDLYYFDINEESEIIQLSDDLFHHRFYAANDSLFFNVLMNIESTEENYNLRIYRYDDDSIEYISDYSLENIHPTIPWIYWKDPYLLVRKDMEESYWVLSINDEYELIDEATIYIPNSSISKILNHKDVGPPDYLYVYCFTTNRILIFDYQAPYHLLHEFNISLYGNYNNSLMFHEDLLVLYKQPTGHDMSVSVGLYHHSFPDFIEEIEFLSFPPVFIHQFTNLNIFYMANFLFTSRDFYSFDYSGMHYLGSYQFDTTYAYYIDFIPELSKLYVSDADAASSYIRRYNLEFTSSTDENVIQIPLKTSLAQNYPNPFNPETTIKFILEREGEVLLEIYNIKGQRVKTLVDEQRDAGEHQVIWNGLDDRNRQMPSGIYFYQMITDCGYREVRKIALIK